ncbi:hypothetical protein V7152_19385 [Neobacillus drentensis]
MTVITKILYSWHHINHKNRPHGLSTLTTSIFDKYRGVTGTGI